MGVCHESKKKREGERAKATIERARRKKAAVLCYHKTRPQALYLPSIYSVGDLSESCTSAPSSIG